MRHIAHRKGGRRRSELPLRAAVPPQPSASPLARLRSDMDRLFEGFFRDPWTALPEPMAASGIWSPDVDVVDGEREVTIRAEIPGIDPKDLDVSVSGDTLSISGEKNEEEQERGKAYVRSERRYGAFRRTLPLPAGIDSGQVSAEYDNGVLTIRIPKTQQSGARRIGVSPPGKNG